MRVIQIQYKTSTGTWLSDINFTGMDSYIASRDELRLASKVYDFLYKRFGCILDWEIIKFYN